MKENVSGCFFSEHSVYSHCAQRSVVTLMFHNSVKGWGDCMYLVGPLCASFWYFSFVSVIAWILAINPWYTVYVLCFTRTDWLTFDPETDRGYRGGSPTAVRPSDPALCGSCPLVTAYYCRLGDLLWLFCLYRFVSTLLSMYMCI